MTGQHKQQYIAARTHYITFISVFTLVAMHLHQERATHVIHIIYARVPFISISKLQSLSLCFDIQSQVVSYLAIIGNMYMPIFSSIVCSSTSGSVRDIQ